MSAGGWPASPGPLSAGRRRRSLAAVMASITVVGTTFGFTLPLLSLVLEARGTASSLIGINTAAQFLGLLVAAPLVPRLLDAAGTFRVMVGAFLVSIAATLLLWPLDSLAWWFALRLLLGAAGVVLIVAGETWINEIVTDRTRGRVLGLYGSMLAAGIAIGPLVIRLTGIEGGTPFVAGALVMAAAALPILAAAGLAPRIGGIPAKPPWGLARTMPVAAAAALACGAVEGAAMSLLPVYALDAGFAQANAADMVTALLLGGVISQVPFGWAADHLDRRRLALGCGFVGALGFAVLPIATGQSLGLTMVTVFAAGTATFGLYTLALILIGGRFRGADLAQANAAIIMLYGIGSMVGPAVAGPAMEWDAAFGLPAALVLFCLSFLAVSVFGAMAIGRRADPSSS